MAREYEMMFKLNAQLGSSYQQAFKSAQESFKQFNAEYRTLSSTANDISGYQRQQSAVENTKAKLDMLQQQYDNIQREMDETGNHSSDLQNKLLAKQAQIDKTSTAYQQQMDKLDAFKQKLQAAGVNTENLDEEYKQLINELDRLKKQYDETGDKEEEFGKKGSEAANELGAALAAAGIVQGLKKVYQAFAECIDATAEFEAGVSQIAATMGKSADEIQDLSAFAKEMGAATSFSAVESADALNVLAMAGLNAEQQMAALPTVLNLAAAGAMEISTAAGYVTGAVKGFSDEMSNSAYYADLMAKGATLANTNVDQLGLALSTSAATASSYGQEAESVTLALLRLAEQNVTGSEAATKLNRAMADLYTPTEEASAVLKKLGVATYDERGNARDLNKVMDDLNTALSSYSMEQQNAYKDTIFSMNGLQAFNKMTVSTSETVERFGEGLRDSVGSAAEQAATQLDNHKGSLTIMNSAAEGAKIALGELYTGALSKVASVLTDIYSWVTGLIQKHPVLVKTIVASTAGFGALVVALTAYVAISKVATAATEALTAAMDSNPYLLAASIIIGIAVALGTFIASTIPAREEAEKLSATSQNQASHIAELNAEYEQVCATMGETSAEAQLLKRELDDETSSFDAQKQTVSELYEELNEMHDAYVEMETAYREQVAGIENEYDSTMSLIAKLQELTSAEEMSISSKEQLLAIIEILNERIPELGLNYDMLTGKLNMTPEDIIAAANSANAQAGREAAFQQLQKDLAQQESYKTEYEKWSTQQAADQDAYNRAKAAADKMRADVAAAGYSSSNRPTKEAAEAAARVYQAEADAEEALAKSTAALATAKEDYEANEAEIIELSNSLANVTNDSVGATDDMTSATNYLREEMEALTVAYTEAYEAAYDSISGQYNLWDRAAYVSETSVSSVIAAQESQTQYWQDYKANIDTLLGYSGEIEGLSEMVATFGDGSAESINMIAGMAASVQSGDTSKLKDLVAAWQENKQAQDAAAQSLADLTTGYTDSMNELTAVFGETLETLNYSEEAATAAESTIQGYIDAAQDMLPAVSAAYSSVGDAAISALYAKLPKLWSSDVDSGGITAYASGTDNATPGFHLVGEEGPELMFFRGGEQVLNARETAELMRGAEPVGAQLSAGGGNYNITLSPQYNITGNESPEEVRAILAEHDAELIRQVREVLQEEAEDARRRAYV